MQPRGLPAECDAVARYEELRKEVLAPSPRTDHGRGLALLLSRGLTTWLRALATVALPLLPLRPLPLAATIGFVPPDLRREVATLLAAMALQQEGLA